METGDRVREEKRREKILGLRLLLSTATLEQKQRLAWGQGNWEGGEIGRNKRKRRDVKD